MRPSPKATAIPHLKPSLFYVVCVCFPALKIHIYAKSAVVELQQRLLLLKHVCKGEGTECQDSDKCPDPDMCPVIRDLWPHLAICNDPKCPVR